MGMSIQVNDFRWEPGKNDREYIKLLEESRDDWKRIAQKAISKLKQQAKAQEPKPPVIKENSYGWKFFYCPLCGREFYADRQHGCVNEAKFCDKCGQAVKWK